MTNSKEICARLREDDTDSVMLRQAADLIEQQAAEIKRLREALTSSGYTKAAYIGEFKFLITLVGEDGDEYAQPFIVPWETTKEIMAAILARAAHGEDAPT